MRRLLLAAMLPSLACGCSADAPDVPGSGTGPARGFAVANFTGVEATGSDDVQVSTGGRFSVRAEGDPAALDRLRVTRDGPMLVIGHAGGFSLNTGEGRTKVFVIMPRITEARVSGSGDIAIDRVLGDRFSGAVTGSGDLTVRALRVRALSVAIAGSGDVALAGEARTFTSAVTGSGELDVRHLKTCQ